MRRLGIGEVCKLLDTKPHVLRYWEEEIPLLEPEKNVGGRRVYGDRELNILYRLKYLITEKRLTVPGAKLALLEEMSGPRANEKAEILALRKNLLDAHEALARLTEKSRAFTGSSFIPDGQEHLREIWKTLPPNKRRNLSADLMNLPSGLLPLLTALYAKKAASSGGAAAAGKPELAARKAPDGGEFSAADDCLASGRLALVTVLPAGARQTDVVFSLRKMAAALREGSKPYGKIPVWYIFTPPETASPAPESAGQPSPAELRTLVRREESFFYDEEKIVFSRQPFFPYLSGGSRVRAGEDGRVAGYASGMAGVFLLLSSPAFVRGLEARGIVLLNILPLNRFSRSFPDRQLLAGHLERGADMSLLADGGRTTGNYIVKPAFLASRSFVSYAKLSAPFIHHAKSADKLKEAPDETGAAGFAARKVCLSFSAFRDSGTVWGIREDE